MNDNDLILAYRKDNDINARNQLILKYTNLIWKIIIKARVPPYVDRNDLYAEGVIALMKCVDMYDLGAPNKFITYAHHAIVRQILRERQKYFLSSKKHSLYQVRNIRRHNEFLRVIDDYEIEYDVEYLTPYQKHLLKCVKEKLHTLTKRQREVFDRLVNGESMKEIAESKGISSNAVAMMRRTIAKRLTT